MSNESEWGPWVEWPGGQCPIPWAEAGEYAIRVDGLLDKPAEYTVTGLPAVAWDWSERGGISGARIIGYRVLKNAE